METKDQVQILPQGQDALQEGLAKRAETMQVVAQARENIGSVAVGHEIHTDEHGNILSASDLAHIRANGPQDERRI